jgi:hypothetical protein
MYTNKHIENIYKLYQEEKYQEMTRAIDDYLLYDVWTDLRTWFDLYVIECNQFVDFTNIVIIYHRIKFDPRKD